MIDVLLNHLCIYLKDSNEGVAFFIGYLPCRDAVAQNVEDGVYITLLTITEDTAAKIPFVSTKDVSRNISKQDSPIIFELSVMISAHFKDYGEGLKTISQVIQKLSDKRKFVTNDFSYSLTMYNLTMDQCTNLWQALSTKILPSVIYKIRSVVVSHDTDHNLGKVIEED